MPNSLQFLLNWKHPQSMRIHCNTHIKMSPPPPQLMRNTGEVALYEKDRIIWVTNINRSGGFIELFPCLIIWRSWALSPLLIGPEERGMNQTLSCSNIQDLSQSQKTNRKTRRWKSSNAFLHWNRYTAVPLIAGGCTVKQMDYYLFSKAQIHFLFCHIFTEYSSLLPQYFLP